LAVSSAGTKASDVSSLLATAGATGVLQALGGVGAAPSQALGSADNLAEISSDMGPLDAMRMRMVPAWENMTRQLAKLNGSDQAAAWGQLSSNILNSKAQGGDGEEVLLDLGADDPSLMSMLDALQDSNNSAVLNLDSARNTASTGALGAAATNAALANPELTDRAAQIQDLADKLGKAMGERLQDQIERGEWKLQLKLNPAHLGKIDVELDMNATGLDAVFKTDNQLTRELIAQGMGKLKDSLAQSGMTVANVWVNSENQQKSGGNSTPRQNTGSDTTFSAPVTEVAAAESRIKELRSSDAWDTLA
jgi:flagellar hook-length control protein FliK